MDVVLLVAFKVAARYFGMDIARHIMPLQRPHCAGSGLPAALLQCRAI